jgi:triosephosphate isomerase
MAEQLAATPIELGAQDLYFEPKGAFTGEVSAAMLLDVGCKYVIVGHSERRHVLGEPDSLIRRKLHAAIAAGLTPILCVGELLEERDRGETEGVVAAQLFSALAGLSGEQVQKIVIAYEPVWAIGTGRTATPDQAEEVQSCIRRLLADRYNQALADELIIQYGGSVKAANAAELVAKPNVDGLLVGGASEKPDQFAGIIRAGYECVSSS